MTRSFNNQAEFVLSDSGIRATNRESCIMVFIQMWLHQEVPGSFCELEGFSLLCTDNSVTSGKNKGGGICVFTNNDWCTPYSAQDGP